MIRDVTPPLSQLKCGRRNNKTLSCTDYDGSWTTRRPVCIRVLYYSQTNISQVLDNAPIHLLRPIFAHLREIGASPFLLTHVLDLIRARVTDEAVDLAVVLVSDNDLSRLRPGIRRALTRHLFGSNDLLSLRLRLAVAQFSWVCYQFRYPHFHAADLGEPFRNWWMIHMGERTSQKLLSLCLM
jgi:hypothetical protein